MSYCSVKWCGKNSRTSNFKKDGITFHRFPRCPDIKSKWIDATYRGEEWFPSNGSVMCSRHFTKDCFHLMKNRRRLLNTAVPTLFLPILDSQAKNSSSAPDCKMSKTDLEVKNSSEKLIMLNSELLKSIGSSLVTEQSYNNQKSDPVTPKRKRTLDPDTPSAYNSPTKKRLCRRLIELKNTIQIKNKVIKKARDYNRRLKSKIISLKSLLAELEKKELITIENRVVLNSVGVKCRELIERQMLKTKSGVTIRKKYSPELRAFALTLNFYSTKAYKYVRKTFNSCLPSVKTLGKWYSTINGRPGFTKEALEALKIKAQQSPKPLYCSIVFDEMKIRSNIEKTYGYVNFGDNIETGFREECTEALVYLIVPFHGKWKVPIGYFLINKINANQKKILLTQAIELCNEANIVIKAVTCDGCPTNLAMIKKFNCNLDPDNLNTVFTVNNNNIAFFLDPAHMVKLLRNSFDHYKVFTDTNSKNICWNHLETLHNLQEKEMFHAANKLRAEHLLFKNNIMKVKLATQLFSRSVAVALRFCKNTLKLKEFDSVEPTADFLLTVNDLFDILDSKVHGHNFKRALNKENVTNLIERLEESKNVLMNLTVNLKNNQIRLIESPRFTGVLGLCVCVESFKFLYRDLIVNDSCPYVSLHRISQDHIELFFCNVRSHGGANDNPTPKQFEGIYKKMLVHMELQDSNAGNCVALENLSILHCSSAIKRINISVERGDDCDTEEPAEDCFIEAVQQISLSLFSESIIEYISGAVVHYLIKIIKCNTCIKALISLEEKPKSLIYARDFGGLIYPSNNVAKICRRCEQVLRNFVKGESSKLYYKDKLRLVTKTMMTFINEDLFTEFRTHQFDHECCNHIVELAKSVADKYIDIRLLYLTRKTNSKSAIRRVYTKLIHFKNQ